MSTIENNSCKIYACKAILLRLKTVANKLDIGLQEDYYWTRLRLHHPPLQFIEICSAVMKPISEKYFFESSKICKQVVYLHSKQQRQILNIEPKFYLEINLILTVRMIKNRFDCNDILVNKTTG